MLKVPFQRLKASCGKTTGEGASFTGTGKRSGVMDMQKAVAGGRHKQLPANTSEVYKRDRFVNLPPMYLFLLEIKSSWGSDKRL